MRNSAPISGLCAYIKLRPDFSFVSDDEQTSYADNKWHFQRNSIRSHCRHPHTSASSGLMYLLQVGAGEAWTLTFWECSCRQTLLPNHSDLFLLATVTFNLSRIWRLRHVVASLQSSPRTSTNSGSASVFLRVCACSNCDDVMSWYCVCPSRMCGEWQKRNKQSKWNYTSILMESANPPLAEWVPVWQSPIQMTLRCNLIKYNSFGHIPRKWCQRKKKIYELPGGCKCLHRCIRTFFFYLLVCALITHNALWIYRMRYVRRAVNASVPARIKPTHSGPLSPVFVASVGD